MWIRTKDGWYVHEIRGACFISWVSSADKTSAGVFPTNRIVEFLTFLSDWTGKELEAVEPHV